MATITLKYKPLPFQQMLHSSLKRWNVLIVHRRAGKTIFSINHLIQQAISKPNGRFAYIAPQRNQAKGVVWDNLKQYVEGFPGVTFNEAELRCDFKHNGARITLLGVDNAQSIRGFGFDGMVLDESQDIPITTWEQVLFPTLTRTKGWAIFVGTPKGKGNNLLWTMLKEARDNVDGNILTPAAKKPNWFYLILPVDKSKVFPQDEIEDIRNTMSEEAFEQEYMCSFDGALPGAFYTKELSRIKAKGQITGIAYDKSLPVHTAWDLGMSDKTAIWFFQMIGNKIHIIDYMEESGLSIPDWCNILNRKEYCYGSHIAPHDIEVRSMDHIGAPTRRETARNFGIDFDIVIPKMAIIEGINAARVLIDRCWFDNEKTERGIECLNKCQPERDKHGNPLPRAVHDEYSHGSDAFRYLACGVPELRDWKPAFDWRANQSMQSQSTGWDVFSF